MKLLLEILQSYNLTFLQWIIVLICGIMIGFTKTSIGGLTMIIIPILAGIFEARPSVGLLLPMLMMGDVFAVKYYKHNVEWTYLKRLLPWTLAGIIIGLLVGNYISDRQFKITMAIIILSGLGIMIWQGYKQDSIKIPTQWWFAMLTGLAGGFATMIGNAAGPIMSVYFLAMLLPKYGFIGTRAWFFMIVNLIKLPLHIIVWKTINIQTLVFNVAMFPAIAIGAVVGYQIVKLIPEKPYRYIIIILTAIAAIKLLLGTIF